MEGYTSPILTVKGHIFTPRQSQVMLGIWQGFSNVQIGKDLMVTEKAVKCHLTVIYKKLGVRSRAQLICLLFKERPDYEKILEAPKKRHYGFEQMHPRGSTKE